MTIPLEGSVYNAELFRVVDGDTIYVRPTAYNKLRLVGVQTPERGQAGFDYATLLTRDWIGTSALRISYNHRDSFGRELATVWRLTDGACLNDYLREKGYGYTYASVKKRNWWQELLDKLRGLW